VLGGQTLSQESFSILLTYSLGPIMFLIGAAVGSRGTRLELPSPHGLGGSGQDLRWRAAAWGSPPSDAQLTPNSCNVIDGSRCCVRVVGLDLIRLPAGREVTKPCVSRSEWKVTPQKVTARLTCMQVQECLKLLREVKAIVGQELLAGPRTTDRSRDMSKDSSWSTQVKTRKITNYTCVERSQKKSWWKFESRPIVKL
jgi:hypothetical protein